jgi:hypothetical protein
MDSGAIWIGGSQGSGLSRDSAADDGDRLDNDMLDLDRDADAESSNTPARAGEMMENASGDLYAEAEISEPRLVTDDLRL